MHEHPPLRSPGKFRVVIVDGHSLVRRGVSALIDREPDLAVCAAVATHAEALEAARTHQPDLVITDLSRRDDAGLRLVRALRAADAGLPILVLTLHDGPEYGRRALAAGASGYVTKQEVGETLLTAIRQLLAGMQYLSPKMQPGRSAI